MPENTDTNASENVDGHDAQALGDAISKSVSDTTDQVDESKDEPLGESGLKALKAERARADAAEKAAAEKDARLKEYEDRDKTEEQKRAEEFETLRAELAATKAAKAESDLNMLRRDVAIAKGIPAALVDRLKGTDKESLEADADALLEVVSKREADGPRKPRPDPTLGQSNAGAISKNDQFNRALEAAFENAP